MDVSNSQVLPVRQRDSFDEIAVKLVANGSLQALDDALRSLGALEPRLLVENFDTYPARTRRSSAEDDPQILTAVIQVKALRAVL
jgi:hypothetical protein